MELILVSFRISWFLFLDDVVAFVIQKIVFIWVGGMFAKVRIKLMITGIYIEKIQQDRQMRERYR